MECAQEVSQKLASHTLLGAAQKTTPATHSKLAAATTGHCNATRGAAACAAAYVIGAVSPTTLPRLESVRAALSS